MPRGLLLLVAACILGGLLQNRGRIERWLNPPPPGSASVVLYATQWCGYCAKTRTFFAEHRIDYQELDVERSEAGRAGYESFGGGGVPLVVINGEAVIRGYRPDAILAALGR